jgi:glycosyltransferase involved in cell wall biosynthesis
MQKRRSIDSRTRVLFIPHHFRQPKDQGGLRSWHVVNQLKEFTDVTVLVPGVDTLSGRRHKRLGWRFWITEDPDDRVRIIWVNALPNIRTSKLGRALYYLSFSALQYLRGIFMRRVDLVLTTSMPVSTMFLAWVTACRHRAPLVLDVRDLSTDLVIELGYFRDGLFARSLQRIEHFIFRRADRIVTVSSGMAEVLGSRLGSERNVHVCPIGFDALETSEPAEHGVWDHLPLEDRFVVLYSGTMGYVVDVNTMLEAARMTRDRNDILYLFVGDGQRREEYQQKSRDDQSNCLFIGRIPKQAIARVCERAQITWVRASQPSIRVRSEMFLI